MALAERVGGGENTTSQPTIERRRHSWRATEGATKLAIKVPIQNHCHCHHLPVGPPLSVAATDFATESGPAKLLLPEASLRELAQQAATRLRANVGQL